MTNSSNDRLDRVERILEAVAQRLEAVAQRQEAIAQQQEINTRNFELLGQRVDSNSKAIAANSDRIAEVDRTLAEAVGRTLAGIEALTERAEEDRVNFAEHVEHVETAIAGINATLAAVNTSITHQARILDYIMRRDRDGNGEYPQA